MASELNLQQRILDEGYALNPGILTENNPTLALSQDGIVEGVSEDTDTYEPVRDYDRLLTRKTIPEKHTTIIDMTMKDIIENTSQCLNDFSTEYSKMLYKVDLELNNSGDEGGFISNIKRHIMAFMMYLNKENNILYIGIILLIISIIIYFINIIRR